MPDMRFGWKPKETILGAPIPLYYDYETFDIPINVNTKEEFLVNYLGPRISNSIDMHKAFSNINDSEKINKQIHGIIPLQQSYQFKFPPNQNLIDAITQNQKSRKRAIQAQEGNGKFQGMNPVLMSGQPENAGGFKSSKTKIL